MRRRAVVLVLLIAVLAGVAVLARELYRSYQGFSGNLVLVVPSGTRAPDVARLLAERGVLERRWPFIFCYLLGRPRHRLLKAGEYLFDRPLAPLDVYHKLVRGEIYLHAVLIPEGSDRFDMARIYHEVLGIDPEAFLRATEATSLIRDLDPRAPTLEGYLYPDTYHFARGATAAQMVQAMVARFRRVLELRFGRERHEADAPLHDVVTLASLVERETPAPEERPVIAGVFARRLQKKWRLGCDPTVVYALRLDHRMLESPPPLLTTDDLKFRSPFNTYLHSGFPPGPIASPGEASLGAAFHPASGDALYFVSNNRGGHIFARTLAEHQRNVARYRREVAELRHLTLRGANASEQRSSKRGRGGNGDAKKSSRQPRHKKQEATYFGIQPHARLGARWSAGNSSHRG